jgi:Secretin and TonB N terminus short domain
MPAHDLSLSMRLAAQLARYRALRSSVGLFAAVALAFNVVAVATESNSSANSQMTFDIPAQPLASALHAFGRRVGVQVLYDSGSAAGRQSIAVQGQLTPDEALKRLLGNADLEIRHASADAITLIAPSPAPEEDMPPVNALTDTDMSLGELRVRATARPNDLARFAEYSDIVRNEIQRALTDNFRGATGSYRAVLDLWIDPNRKIRKATLLQPTGDEGRDKAITAVIQGLTISRAPPSDVRQPIRAVVAMRTLQ